MTAAEKVAIEIAKLDAILAKRGGFYEDEQAKRDAFGLCALWMDEERDEIKRIEAEAAAAEEVEREEKRRAATTYKGVSFANVKINVPEKGNRR